jgi:hypothetical protein
MRPYTLYPSTVKGKRYTIYIPKGDKQVKVDFGSSSHDNFTIHKDPERKRLYRLRHKNDNINDPYSPGYWSWWVLWNKPSLMDSMEEAVVRATVPRLRENPNIPVGTQASPHPSPFGKK